jgi:SH3-like domain-containing protein
MQVNRSWRFAWSALFASVLSASALAQMRQTVDNATILFDSPSGKSTKLFVLGPGIPVDTIVSVAGWVKVRDAGGSLGWVEPRQLVSRANVQVKVPFASIRAQANEAAPVVFSAERDVLLRLVDTQPSNGWVRVAHRDGATGFVRIESLFGI